MPKQFSINPEVPNELRSDAAKKVLIGFAQEFGEIDQHGGTGELAEQNLTDLLVDLAHYCDRRGLAIQDCVRRAARHYRSETDNSGSQFAALSL